MLVDGSADGTLSEAAIQDALKSLKTVILDIKGTKVKIWRRPFEKLSCLSLYDSGWSQKLNIHDSWIENVGKESKGDLGPGGFALAPGLGMQLMYRVAKAIESDHEGIFEKNKLLELRTELLKDVTFPEDLEDDVD